MKMNVKKILGSAAAIFISIPALFANNERGIDLYRAGLYEAAKYFFLEQTGQSPKSQAENYYYLGQVYKDLEKADSAAYYYAKAIEAEANYPFGYIGEGSLALMSGKMSEAEELFKKAEGMNKKDASVSVAIAEAYIEVKQYPKAQQSIEKAKKADKKYAGTFMAEGDLFKAKEENLGLAAGNYESALRLNKKEKSAYLKLEKLYEQENPKVALYYLDQMIANEPE
ncbi:MAG: tetratricopeptide repeat protein, partial [Dysgonamonadaceae bacterium]|nr:tetratricopeptide repeat protein [Dysgonamonadaceae bacterium]